MKAIIISILLFFTVYLPDGKAVAQNQNIWYVNRDATGQNNGTSWANAWKSFNNINWEALSGGDTVYVSGGSDSTTYPAVFIGSYMNPPAYTYSGNGVVIARAWHSGHSGDVVIAGTNNGSRVFKIGMVCNVKVYGFIFDCRRQAPTGEVVRIGESDWGDLDSLITIENCTIYHPRSGGAAMVSSKHTIKNCTFISSGTSANDVDPISMAYGRGGHSIIGNKIIMANTNVGTDSHRDGIQISNIGLGEEIGGIYATERLTTIIANNLIIDTAIDGTSWNAMIYSSGPYCNQTFYVYNNIMVNRKNNTGATGIWIGKGGILPWTKYKTSLHILNNTIITKTDGSQGGIITAYNHDTLIVKNNIFVRDTSVGVVNNLDGSDGFPFCYKVYDYNYFGLQSNPTQAFSVDNGVNISWNSWRQAPYNDDVHSSKGTNVITFANKYGLDKQDYFTETGRDAGIDLSADYPFLATDILGNARGNDLGWDLGALEFGGVPPNGVNVKGKVFLQGPFSNNSMSTTLNQSSLLPNSQPYNQPPWNYNGNESFSSGPNSTMVDWVLVELRSASNPAQVVARRAAVLKNNGLLLSTNGIEGVHFNNVDAGSYYIAVYHRNHLAIMSAAPVQLSSNSAVYDFTTAMSKAYGQNPMVELTPGKFGMYATDGNADGIVNSADRDDVWLIQNGNMGYLGGDFNMNSGVTVHDVNQLWNPNNGAVTQVP